MADNINKELRDWRKAKRLTQQEAGDLLGISRAYYANLEYGQSIPDHVKGALEKHGFGLDSYPRVAIPTLTVRSMPMVQIPIVGIAGAGVGERNTDPESDLLEVPLFMTFPGCLGWRTNGDSMYPSIKHGDIAIFRPETHYRNGKTYLFQKDGELFIKKLKWKSGTWWMHSLNPSYEDMNTLDTVALGILTGTYSVESGTIETRSNFDGLDLPEWQE